MWILQISKLTKNIINNHVLAIFSSKEEAIKNAKKILETKKIVDFIESNNSFNFKINRQEYSITIFQPQEINKELENIENF